MFHTCFLQHPKIGVCTNPRLNPRPSPPIESKVHSPSFAGDPGNVHNIRWTRHCCLPSLGTNTYPPIQKKKTHFFEWMIFYKIRVRICWMLVSWTVYFLLIVDCFHQSCQLQTKMLHLHKLVLNVDEIRRVRFSFTTSTFTTNQVNLITSVYQHMICQWSFLLVGLIATTRHLLSSRLSPLDTTSGSSGITEASRTSGPSSRDRSGLLGSRRISVHPLGWNPSFLAKMGYKKPIQYGKLHPKRHFRPNLVRKSFLSPAFEFPSNTRTCDGVTRSI